MHSPKPDPVVHMDEFTKARPCDEIISSCCIQFHHVQDPMESLPCLMPNLSFLNGGDNASSRFHFDVHGMNALGKETFYQRMNQQVH